jgi:spore germination protein KC
MERLKAVLLCGCTGLLFLLAGCWDLVELNELSVVGGMAVDAGEDQKYKITVESINAAELGPQKSGGTAPAALYSVEGDNISEIVKKFNIGLSRKLIFSHMRVIVISEEVAEKGIDELLDFLVRNREIRNDFNIIVAKGSEAKDVLSITYQLQKVSSLKLNAQLNALKKEWGGDPGVRLQDVQNAIQSQARDAIMESVKIKGEPDKGEKMTNMQTVLPDAMVEAEGAAIFRGDRLVGYLSISDVRNYSMITDNIRTTVYTVPCGEEEDGELGIRVYVIKVKSKVQMKEDRPLIDIKLVTDSYLESSSCKGDLSKLSLYKEYEQKISAFIERELTETIEKTQEEEADVFGFGEKLGIAEPQKFEEIKQEWGEYFKEAEVRVKVRTRLRRAGLEKESFVK